MDKEAIFCFSRQSEPGHELIFRLLLKTLPLLPFNHPTAAVNSSTCMCSRRRLDPGLGQNLPGAASWWWAEPKGPTQPLQLNVNGIVKGMKTKHLLLAEPGIGAASRHGSPRATPASAIWIQPAPSPGALLLPLTCRSCTWW